MPARILPCALLALALLVPATGAGARTHHRTTSAHATPRHHAATHKTARSHGNAKPSHRHETKRSEQRAAAPGGATSVPGTGLKVFCPSRKNPLLIRKATQGAGTTVTVVCR